MKSYYKSTRLRRIYNRFRHPKLTLRAFNDFGVWSVVKETWSGGLFPPLLKYWAVQKGWQRKHPVVAVSEIQDSTPSTS